MFNLKLRTRILLSYILIIAIFVCGVYFIFDFYAINRITNEHIQLAKDSVSSITDANRRLSRRTLSQLGETILKLVAERNANSAAIYLNKKGKKYQQDYNVLRKDKEFRDIVAHAIYVYGRKAGYTDLIDDKGVSVVHINSDIEGENFSIWQNKFPKMWELVKKSFKNDIVSGHYEFINLRNEKSDKFMVICRVPGTRFRLVAAVSINRYFGPVHEKLDDEEEAFSELVIKKIKTSSLAFSQKVKIMSTPFILIVILICLLLGLWISSNISQPLKALMRGVRNIGKGNFSVKVPEQGSFEAMQLAKAFNQLGGQLLEYTESLKEEEAARMSVEGEIKIARSIQESLLPKKFPSGEWYDVYAELQPAKEVAGDFYDCFMIKDKLFMIIGDVSGKGVPAAFFMAVVRTLLRDLCHNYIDPGKILSKANKILCEENETCMFVTLFLGVYDINSGEMRYANGGHNEILRKKTDETIDNFGFTGDMALGIIEDNEYKVMTEKINIDDVLIMYTDGVSEAISPDQVLYGIERLSGLVQSSDHSQTPEQTCNTIVNDVLEYEAGNRFDDITVLVFRRLL